MHPSADPFRNFDKTFLLIGLGVLLVFHGIGWPFVLLAAAKSLTCDRSGTSPHRCLLQAQQGPLSWEKTLQSFPVSQLQGAALEESPRSERNLYRVMIVTPEQAFPLTDSFSSGQADKAAIANQINAFVNDPEQSRLQVIQDDRWVFYLIGGIFILTSSLVGGAFVWIGLSFKQP